ncbi:MAG: outer membrane protein assembly factor BamB [Burkholderiales bacterium]|nr:outer membrane protein assembly factor BamB [Burkholderiales bacterium]MDE1927832.1 outer membrane protein assembly factor BamB [Burkholderiales bacterium]MDE2159709.1 outer membrane protein assembly factor BamB [Burkholderiales bacterium]MDE2501911.1 outer membrane protein assembly factor BamB [Burkholderiales bacterium]
MRLRRAAAVALVGALALLGACSSDKPKPTPLQHVDPRIKVDEVWHRTIDDIDYPMVAAAVDGTFYVGAGSGELLALRASDGAELWRAKVPGGIAAGVGSDGRYVSVATRGNEIVVYQKGKELWRQRIPAAVVTPPLVAGERVFVMGVNRAVYAFDAQDGRRLWSYARPGEALTLAQSGVVAPFHNTLLVGQAQRLAGLEPLHGELEWEVALATPRGTNEVERLADLVGPLVRLGDKVCMRSFQNAVGCVDASTGKLLWSHNVGGIEAVAGDDDVIVGGDASDRITAWRTANGNVAWTSDKLLYRGLSGAAMLGSSVVFGDYEGYLHFLSRTSGELQLRLSTNGKAVVGTPIVEGGTMLVSTRNGGLYAFRRP